MSSTDYDRIAEAIHYIDTHVQDQPSLADVAGHLGLSEFHFQRLFHRWAGVTPKDFLRYLTLRRAKPLLVQSNSLLEASLAVGLSGSGRLHDLFASIEAMTPGEYKQGARGLTIGWGLHPTPLGLGLFAATSRGLCGLSFVEADGLAAAVEALAARWPEARLVEDPAATEAAAREVSARMQGQQPGPLSLVLKGTPFQLKVWEALLTLPEGQVTTYSGLAAAAGAPGASRAVGTAMGNNPIGYLIPCHRVIRASGALGEYRWGEIRKKALLALEGARHHHVSA